MAINTFEMTTNALCCLNPDNADESGIETTIDNLYTKLNKFHFTNEMIDIITDLHFAYEKKGYRDGFAAGIKLIMQSVGHEMK
ncbi:hypothetical protein [Sporomusa acidovorans]|uniref:TipAS antibiotic-recognition domain-containing protein n=1 Tax=Sporomusa acidovorans (strain ATCC 49682 / DSM 3132 / Mol) TaxID=1123286 RepID=A0ABZ3IY99_SPOA4|nr:hypothetical protein [Sporomusa acidovorans]OZC16809.1 hypothetical protein SPACI_40290 [Sporomusa acidovorans DSM 3132]SDF79167.1 hypothetical protein SAMN04488499_10848 [Sporomusa acidovorans]